MCKLCRSVSPSGEIFLVLFCRDGIGLSDTVREGSEVIKDPPNREELEAAKASGERITIKSTIAGIEFQVKVTDIHPLSNHYDIASFEGEYEEDGRTKIIHGYIDFSRKRGGLTLDNHWDHFALIRRSYMQSVTV